MINSKQDQAKLYNIKKAVSLLKQIKDTPRDVQNKIQRSLAVLLEEKLKTEQKIIYKRAD
ncbi:hypothetical protein RG47T_0512 [Mucilaginibacter polytrichastri]|uniref:Uncharacterized protein n=2 Tax=Mucilaginibacter polytrichastri TaxID=1302689 RepID=A0A1Q5ZTL5_9SPHI|nr:hypothetical protein RG47T_0512 [Mucilaginibacter polytrichastri]